MVLRGAFKGLLLSMLPSATFAAFLWLLSFDGGVASPGWSEEALNSVRLVVAVSASAAIVGALLGVLAARLRRGRLARLVCAACAGYLVCAGAGILALPPSDAHTGAGSILALVCWTIVAYAPVIGGPLGLATWLLERWTRSDSLGDDRRHPG